jgi:hypothetical protein
VTVKRKKNFSRFAPRARAQGSKVKRETKKHCAFDGCRDGKDIFFFFCASRFVPASKLQKESEKKKMSVQSMVKNFFFLFALRALCPRLSFNRKARKKNEYAIDGEEFFFCSLRSVPASKLQKESERKK